MTLSLPPGERGPSPESAGRLRVVEHWCEIVSWLCKQYAEEYQDGDLRSRLAIYHAMGLIADATIGLDDDTRAAIPAIDWKELVKMRVILVHCPWKVNARIVWESATEDIPLLLAEMRRFIAEQSE